LKNEGNGQANDLKEVPLVRKPKFYVSFIFRRKKTLRKKAAK